MRELHGVVFGSSIHFTPSSLKHYGLLFDRLHVVHFGAVPLSADLEFLESRGIVSFTPVVTLMEQDPRVGGFAVRYRDGFVVENRDHVVRRKALTLIDGVADILPVYEEDFPQLSNDHPNEQTRVEALLRFTLNALPVPGELSSWDDILAFKAEEHDKAWAFRRWLHSIATRPLTEAEIHDELEWSINEYTKAMDLHRLKASYRFLDVFVVTPLELLEDLVKIKWSRIAKGMLSARSRKVELLEAEMKAPGKECAYIVDARKRFSSE
jgi:hypothetical protein